MKIYIIHFKIKKIPEEWLILQKITHTMCLLTEGQNITHEAVLSNKTKTFKLI